MKREPDIQLGEKTGKSGGDELTKTKDEAGLYS